jgi:hypothetical protein
MIVRIVIDEILGEKGYIALSCILIFTLFLTEFYLEGDTVRIMMKQF